MPGVSAKGSEVTMLINSHKCLIKSMAEISMKHELGFPDGSPPKSLRCTTHALKRDRVQY
jgi:hypothetical protein